MIGVVMAGGKGSRMKLSQEKLLLQYKKPIILHVLDALNDSGCFSNIIAITSPNSPQTSSLIEEKYDTMESSGEGFVKDLAFALKSLDGQVFVAPADLPLLDGDIVRQIIHHKCDANWLSVLVTKQFRDLLGLSPVYGTVYNDIQCCYTGISVVDSSGIDNITHDYMILDDKRVAFNLNTRDDYLLLDVT